MAVVSAVAVNGPAMRALRKKTHMSQQDLAFASQISSHYVQSIELGRRIAVSPDVMKRLCVALNLDDPKALAASPRDVALVNAINEIVAAAPPLSDEKKAILSALLTGDE